MLTSSLHSPVGLFSWCVAKVMLEKAQDSPEPGAQAKFREGGIVSFGWVCVFWVLS